MLEIKEYKNGDEEKIMELFEDVFKQEMPLQYWKWNYNNELFSDKYINLMWDKNILAGHYAIIPVNMMVKNKLVKTGLSMTTMTSCQYGKRGIFKNLATDLYTKIYNEVDLVWGFPNNNSIYGFLKNLSWKQIMDITMYTCETYKANNKSKHIKSIFEFDEKFDRLFENVKNRYSIIVCRDSKYLNWRYKENPQNKYLYLVYEEEDNYLGYCIYKLYKNENEEEQCDIVDMLAINEEIFTELLKYTLDNMAEIKVEHANLWMNNVEFLECAKKVGFIETSFKTHVGCKINGDNLDEDVYNYNNWYLTMGDSDVF
jgi:hypothetical protein